MATQYANGRIVTDGLVLNLNAADPNSYPGSGTTWTDISGNGNTGTLTNGPTFNSANGGSIVFDGVDDYSNILNSTSLQVADVFTISVWFNATSLPSRHGLFTTRTANTAGCWQIEAGVATGGTNKVAVTGVGTWIWESNNNVISTNSWYNACFVKPGNATVGGNMYVNGSLISPITTTAYTIQNNSDAKAIGVGTGYGSPFPGRIASTYLYNRALSASEVLQNYNATKARFGLK